jgi:hypothetical protein
VQQYKRAVISDDPDAQRVTSLRETIMYSTWQHSSPQPCKHALHAKAYEHSGIEMRSNWHKTL